MIGDILHRRIHVDARGPIVDCVLGKRALETLLVAGGGGFKALDQDLLDERKVSGELVGGVDLRRLGQHQGVQGFGFGFGEKLIVGGEPGRANVRRIRAGRKAPVGVFDRRLKRSVPDVNHVPRAFKRVRFVGERLKNSVRVALGPYLDSATHIVPHHGARMIHASAGAAVGEVSQGRHVLETRSNVKQDTIAGVRQTRT